MIRLAKSIFAAVALAIALPAPAQVAVSNPAPAITINWNLVTTMSDGTPLPGPISYNLYGGHTLTGPWSAPVSLAGPPAVRTGVEVGLDCYYLTAVVNGVESLPTQVSCVTITAALPSTVPATPTGFTATQSN